MYKFVKDHLDNKVGDEINSHQNLDYLISVGVISKVEKPAPKTTKKVSDGLQKK